MDKPLDLLTVIDSIPALVVCALPDGSLEFVNRTWREYTGCALDRLTGKGWQTVIHPDDVSRFIEEWSAARAAGRPFENEARVRRADGEYRWFLIKKVPQRDASGQIVRWHGAAYNIEDRKQAEDRIRLVVDTTPALIHTGRPDGYLDYFNQRWLEYLGLSLQDVCGWQWTNVIHPEDVEGILQKWRAALATGEPFETETRVRRADGAYRWMLHRKVPLRDSSGTILKWHGSSLDIEDRKQAEQALRLTESFLVHAQRLTKAGTWAYRPPDICEYWSAEMFRIFGYDPANGYPPNDDMIGRVHPEDRKLGAQAVAQLFEQHREFDQKYRFIRPDGQVRVIQDFGTPVFENGIVTRFVGACLDITEQEQMTQELKRREAYLADAQRLSHTGNFGWNVLSQAITWSDETFRIFEYDRTVKPSFELGLQRIHPDDRDLAKQIFGRASTDGAEVDYEHRLLMPDGRVKHVQVLAHAVKDSSGNVDFIGAITDITNAKQAEEALRRSEEQWRHVFENNPTMYFMVDAAGIVLAVNPFGAEQLGYGVDELLGQPVLSVFYELERETARSNFDRCLKQLGQSMSWELRKVRKNGSVLWVRETARAVLRENEPVVLIACEDITERKLAEEKIREQETELRQILDLAPQHVHVLAADASLVYTNQVALKYHGSDLKEWQDRPFDQWCADELPFRSFHPDDRERMMSELTTRFLTGSPHETEARLQRNDGKYRWFLFRFNPLRDGPGRVMRWYVAGTDIEDRKQSEERLRDENVALREEIDKTSMFEEVVGTSPALQAVLSRLSKVAPTASTVLITGETGTGKELVARAIHRRSHRASRAFVSVNCAAIPRDLIASELFGHEKGAFTGAIQKRLGRFELAGGGTIFLDEVGELPAETQVALLRVLQEQEFERVGGTKSIQTDVRVIAATNRDLKAAIAAGVFRSDLFYRLNVFPIEIPPLRNRKEDIVLLVEYFIDRYARKAGKNITGVNKKTLDLLQSYAWPGNIRELQNVVERSVIVCETENFSVDESWISRPPHSTGPISPLDLSGRLAAQEKEMIEAALRDCDGRVFGPSGAAAKLGMPRSTLESKIRSLKIDKNRFKP
jgi:PAS domain S-box-containing protein